jgi:hypothetical protein
MEQWRERVERARVNPFSGRDMERLWVDTGFPIHSTAAPAAPRLAVSCAGPLALQATLAAVRCLISRTHDTCPRVKLLVDASSAACCGPPSGGGVADARLLGKTASSFLWV